MAKWLGRKLERVFLVGSFTGFLLLLSMQVVGNGRVKLEPNFTRDNEAKYSRRTCETGGDNTSQLRATVNTTFSVSHKVTGYLIAFRYYEQQTQALRNYLQFQCLGNSFGMRIVEPFIRKSFFSFPFDELLAGRNLLQLGDLIDLDLWNQQTTSKFGFPPVSSWINFLKSAPKKIIIGCIKYRDTHHIRPPSPGFDYRMGCPRECFNSFNRSLTFLRNYGFQLVRRVCANFVDFGGTVTVDKFLADLTGKFKPKNVTILLNEFRGLFGLTRLPVLSECGIRHHKTEISINPSAIIMKDAKRYVFSVFHNQPYIAILVRVERVVLHLHRNITTCAKNLRNLLDDLYKTHKIDKYFLAMDVGKFGSQGSTANHLQPHGMVIFNAVYKRTWTFETWEESCLKYASNDNPAYIANLQRAIAAMSQCFIMVGEGGFQAQARALYQRLHPETTSWCIHKICGEYTVDHSTIK